MRVRHFAAAAAFTLLVAGCGGSDAGNEAEEEGSAAPTVAEDVSFDEGTTMFELNEAGELRVGTKFDQPGFGLLNPTTNQPEGFDVEIAYMIAAALGIPEDGVTFTESVSANREPFIQNDTVDIVVATYTINDTRKTLVSFAGPYYVAGQDIMVAAGNPEGITGPDDLAGKTVCSVEGSTPAENIRTNYPEVNLITTDVYSKCADQLKNSGESGVVAVTTDNVILTAFVATDPESFELVGNPFTEEPYGIGLALDDDDFRDFINDVLEEAYESGAWA
ncbi:MAG: glutamate ABC transporter substrate-binding protein, partial [Actinomycetota bacterium]|nr:glutamate ABC transporter substrate-binding protein [Actinomycetota bacterium]